MRACAFESLVLSQVRNCQAFAADFFAFAAGRKGISVFSPILQPRYTQRTHLFLYDPEMYDNPTPDTRPP